MRKTILAFYLCLMIFSFSMIIISCDKDDDNNNNPTSGTFTDSRDSNTYNWIKIGNQTLMTENLAYLPAVNLPDSGSDTIAYFYVYDYKGTSVIEAKATSNYKAYGVLYNWTAAMNRASPSTSNPSGVQGACPSGWHLPSDEEWIELINYLGGDSIAGGKLKETDTSHWKSPNKGATNSTGFTALPGGDCNYKYQFSKLGSFGDWWSTNVTIGDQGITMFLYYNEPRNYSTYTFKYVGISVRCVKD